MTPIEHLQSLPLDSFDSFDAAHRILMDPDASMADKLVALARIDAAMGGTGEPITACQVNDYIRLHQSKPNTPPQEPRP